MLKRVDCTPQTAIFIEDSRIMEYMSSTYVDEDGTDSEHYDSDSEEEVEVEEDDDFEQQDDEDDDEDDDQEVKTAGAKEVFGAIFLSSKK